MRNPIKTESIKRGKKIIGYRSYVGGFEAKSTVREASQVAVLNLLEASEHEQYPRLIHVGEYTALWWYATTSGQYSYSIVHGPDRSIHDTKFLSSGSAGETESEARRAVQKHLADLSDRPIGYLQGAGQLSSLTDEDIRDLQSNEKWRTDMADLMSRGMTSEEARLQLSGYAWPTDH